MAQTIQIKRGLAANLPASLAVGELAYTTDTQKFYVGTGSGRVEINGIQDLPDVGTPGTYYKVTTDAKGRVTAGVTTLSTSDITGLGTAASKNIGTTSGTVPLIGGDGKLDASILPALAITNTFVVATQQEMLALDAQIGDIAVRTDLSTTFILQVTGADTLDHWVELETPADAVTSVNGKTGVVTLNKSDVGLGNVDNTADASKTVAAAGKATNDSDGNAINTTYAKLAGPTFTGTPKAPTASAGTNTTQLATTAFVKTAVDNKTSVSGNAGTATKLQTARTIATSGGVTGTATSFDGSANITIPVTAIDPEYLSEAVPIDKGGTGATTAAAARTALAAAPIASPAFTGTPTASTAIADTTTTQLATTAFVINQASTTAPAALAASATVGTSKKYARADHAHAMPTSIDGGTF